ncbi:hypothetical protein FQA39_LY05072 [Lamprigera yunnana]|nr:hypothetical protein FQA39_LY05072 [Lamprigera yunnana]
MYGRNFGQIANGNKKKRGVYLKGANFNVQNDDKRITPVRYNVQPLVQQSLDGIVYECIKPMILLMRSMGVLPLHPISETKQFKIAPILMIYSIILYIAMLSYVGYVKWDKVEIVRSTEEKFEEAVIDYLFSVYLFPVVLVPITWYECIKMASVFNDWHNFESIYKKLNAKNLPVFTGNKPLIVTIILPIVSCGSMVINHITMAHFRTIQIIPYCYINTITFILGGIWYLQCDIIARVAILIAHDFGKALRHIGPSQIIAEYRALWMLLSKIVRDVGMASYFALTFLCLYLFLIITLTIYGLLSQIQEGFGIKDIGLTITAGLAIAILYFICDEAHYASNSVKVLFQKKLLLVELSWMNDDAQQEIQMFLRATEMSETNMSLGGFFDVNRTLFKSLLATMVTYLVVLLQFQISLPEDNTDSVRTTFSPIEYVKTSGCESCLLRLTCRHFSSIIVIIEANFETGATNNTVQKTSFPPMHPRLSLNQQCSGVNHCSFVLTKDCPGADRLGFGTLNVKYACISERHITKYCNREILLPEPETLGISQGFIHNPGYPRFYLGKESCRWSIQAPLLQRIKIIIFDISLVGNPNINQCADVLDISDKGQSLHSTCTQQEPPIEIISLDESLNITLIPSRTESLLPTRGVLLYYTAVGCLTPNPPHNGYLVYRNNNIAEYSCCVGYVFLDTHSRGRTIKCLGYKWDTVLPMPDCKCVSETQQNRLTPTSTHSSNMVEENNVKEIVIPSIVQEKVSIAL